MNDKNAFRRLCLVAAMINAASGLIQQQPGTLHHRATIDSRDVRLNAVTVVAEADQGFSIVPIGSTMKKAWPQRLVKKVFRRNQELESTALLADIPTDNSLMNATDSFVVRGYESLVPSKVLPLDVLRKTEIVTAKEALSDTVTVSPPLPGDAHSGRTSPPFARVTMGKAEKALATLVHRWTRGSHRNLQVHCDPNGGVVDLVKGLFRADATIQFDRLAFGAIRMSKGKLVSRRLALNLYKFAPFCKRIPRFASAFDLEAKDITFSQEDLFESNCIRNGLRRLLTRILHNRGMSASTVEITSIKILPTGKLSITGSATTLFDSKVDFEVRSGLDVEGRGHVLTFPGLEISVGPSFAMGLFVPVVPPISLDMGSNAAITKVSLNGKQRTLELSCRATITPHHTRKLVEYEQRTNAYAASFHFDVGRWLTRLGRFSE